MRNQFDVERNRRLCAEFQLDGRTEIDFRLAVADKFSLEEGLIIMDALQFAKSLEYSHPGFSKEAYLNHPLRVATCIVRDAPFLSYEATIVALLHNVLEVSDVTINEISRRYGESVSIAIEILTIDRCKSDNEYKRSYYEKIESGPAGCKIVKVFDKLDNVFMICFNPSEIVRMSYLNEIEEMVLPLVKDELPKIHDYFLNLNNYMREIGYIDKQLTLSQMTH